MIDDRTAPELSAAALDIPGGAGLVRGLPPEEALRLATAAGALNVTRRGRGTGRAEDVVALVERVDLREVVPEGLSW